MNKTLLTILILAVLLVGGILLFSFAQTDTDRADNGNGEDIERNNGDDDDVSRLLPQMYTSSDFDFSIRHVSDAEVSIEAGNNTKFLVTGPNAQPNTEVTDGYVFTVSAYPRTDYATLRTLAEDRADSVSAIGEVTEDIRETRVQGVPAYTFESQSISSPVTHFFVASPNWYYQLSYSVSGEQGGEYAEQVNAMVGSFNPVGGLIDGTEAPSVHETVSIAVLDTEAETDGVERGCDRVVMIERAITPTTAPLTAAMNELFSLNQDRITDGDWFHFIARTNDTLTFDRAVVDEGTAYIYLEGELSGLAGVCDNPRARIQIEETALQFSTVDTVVLYLNGEETTLTPDGRGE